MRIRVKALGIILGATAVLAGCAQSSARDESGGNEIPANPRIGVVFLTADRPVHIHVGSTPFQNFQEGLGSSWNIEDATLQYLKARLGAATIVPIDPTAPMRKAKSMLSPGWTEPHLNPDLAADIRKLGKNEQLNALIVLVPTDADRATNPGIVDGGYGLYSRCRLGSCKAEVLDHVSVQVFGFLPPRYVARNTNKEKEEDYRVDVNLDDSVHTLDDEDIAKVRTRYFQILGHQIDSALANSGLDQLGQVKAATK